MAATRSLRSFVLVLAGVMPLLGCTPPRCAAHSGSTASVASPPPTRSSTGDEATSSEASFPRVDEIVIVQRGASSFTEARVERIKTPRVLVTWAEGSQGAEILLSDIFALPLRGAKPAAKVGDYVLTNQPGPRARWEGALVTDLRDGVVTIRFTSSAKKGHVSPDRIIPVPSAVAATLKSEGDKVDFLLEAKRHRPVRAPSFKPKVGDAVVALGPAGDWQSGTVEAIKLDKATVVMKEDSEATRIAMTDIVPEPDARTGGKASPGAFVLFRDGGNWGYARIETVRDAELHVVTPEADKRTVTLRDVLLLE